jgi:hypothetical protein
MSAHGNPDSHGHDSVRFERTDVHSRPVVIAVVSLAVFTVVFTFIALLVYRGLQARQVAESAAPNPMAAEYAAKQPPEPRLQVDPKSDLLKLRAYEDAELGKLAWVDKSAGTVQVPIERAMQMLVAKGLPSRPGPVPPNMVPQTGFAPDQAPPGSGAPDYDTWLGNGASAEAPSAASEVHGH